MKYFFLLFPLIISAQLTNISGFVKSESGNLGYASVSLLNSMMLKLELDLILAKKNTPLKKIVKDVHFALEE